MLPLKFLLLCFLVRLGRAQTCDWDQSTDPNQGLHPDSFAAGTRYLSQIQQVPDPESCRTACCGETDCDLALVGQPADGPLQCQLVSCGPAGCSLQYNSQFQVFRKTQQSKAEQVAPTSRHIVPLLETEEPPTEEPPSNNNDICHLPKKVGPCRGSFTRFFYNVTTQTCTSFIFGGCLANGNNFQSQEECNNACNITGSAPPEEVPTSSPEPAPKAPRMAPPFKPEISTDQFTELCEAEYDQGPCKAYFKRWYYNKERGICQTFIYGGCQGNKNNYLDEDQCKSTCTGVSVLPSSKKMPDVPDTDRCSLSPETGMCRGYFTKFYYDSDYGRCKSFIYGGCGGNDNKFESEENCMSACSGTGRFNGHGQTRSRWAAAFFLFITLAIISALLLATLVIMTVRRHRQIRRYSSISDERKLIPDKLSSQDSLNIPESPKPEPKA